MGNKQKERISAKNGLESYCFNMKTTIEDEKVPTRSARTTRRRSLTSVTSPSSGWTLTSSPRWRSSRTSRRRWRECATPSSPSSTSRLEELQEACLTWEECQVVCQELVQEVLLQEVQDLDQPSRRLTKFN